MQDSDNGWMIGGDGEGRYPSHGDSLDLNRWLIYGKAYG
jgi:hypothetical protein